jgi:hypothetical protein
MNKLKTTTILLTIVFGFGTASAILSPESWRKGLLGLQKTPAQELGLSRSVLVIDEKRLDFGDAWESRDHVYRLPIRNGTDRQIQIKEINRSCACAKVEPETMALAPGETCELRATFDLSSPWRSPVPKSPPDTTKDFSVKLDAKFIISGDTQPHFASWTVKGVVHKVLSFEPDHYTFGESIVLSVPSNPGFVSIREVTPLKSLVAKCGSNHFLASLEKRLGGNSVWGLTIKAKDTVPEGEFAFPVQLIPVSIHGDNLPAQEYFVEGNVVNDVQVQPPSIVFGAVPEGSTQTASLVLHSLTGKGFEVKNVSCSSKEVSVTPVGGSGNERRFAVTVTNCKAGPCSLSIKFSLSKSLENKLVDVPVTVSFLGVEKEPRH